MIRKRDYIIVSLINGATLGVLGYLFQVKIPEVPFWAFGVFGLAAAPFGLYVFRKIPALVQFIKFGHVGALNTGIDFAVLNLLIGIFKVYSGPTLAVLNAAAFLTSVLNSYFWNKFWTFQGQKAKAVVGQFVKFFVVTVIGVVLNSFVVFLITSYIKSPSGVGEGAWVNMAKAIATVISLIWNFVGYKIVVFRF